MDEDDKEEEVLAVPTTMRPREDKRKKAMSKRMIEEKETGKKIGKIWI